MNEENYIGQDEISNGVQVALYSTVGTISFLTNSLIFIVIIANKKLHTNSYFLILNLALTDWLITVLGIPVQLVNLVLGENKTKNIACNVFGFMILVPFLATNFNLTLIAIHRYTMVVKNKQYRNLFTKRNIVFSTSSVWLASILISIPPFFGWGRFAYNPDRAHCMVDWKKSTQYLVFLQIFSYPIPMATMCFCYYSVFKHTIESKKKLKGSLDGHKISRNKYDLRLSIMLLMVLCCFFMLYLPYAILIVYEGLFQKKPSHTFSFLSLFFAYVNSMVDFWIYAAMSTQFRQALFRTFHTKLICLKKDLKINPRTSDMGEGSSQRTTAT